MDLMRKFVAVAGKDCTIILLSGDADYYGTLSDLKKLHNVSIHLIRLENSFSPKLDQIADYTFVLNDGVLKPVKSTGSSMCFISIKNYPLSINISHVMTELNAQANGSIESSALLYDSSICVGFPTLWNAERAIEQLNGLGYHGHFLKAELVVDSPLTEILKCIKPVQTKSNNEVKQLTFIKMNNSNEVDISKFIKFCIACTSQLGSQCILTRKPFLWIVFSYKSDAQKVLPKVQIMYPDAIISEPQIDFTLSSHENAYTVESCEQKVSNETSSDSGADNSNIAIVKPERAMQINLQDQSSSITPVADIRVISNIEPKASVTTNVKPQKIINFDVPVDKERRMFFRCGNYSVSHLLDCQPTKWSLLYNLFEKLYDLGAKKVICDGNLYCAHFDSASAYQEAFEKMHSRYFEPLEFANVPKLRENEVTKKLDRYITGIPWCLNQELDLRCHTAKVESNLHEEFIEMSKNILGNHECIFIKSVPEEIWIGFPDELICRKTMKILLGLLSNLGVPANVSMGSPSNELLESINFHDLAGDAYDLAFLSRLFESSESIYRPNIIERISHQRMEVKECNDAVFHITVTGNFNYRPGWLLVRLSQIVKIFVNFSKVIPLAATASFEKVNLIFNTWHEAHAARHFIKNLKTDEVPYFREFRGAGIVQQQPLDCSTISEYYFINDQRKVLEKIVQNKNQVAKLNSNLSTVQSTEDISVKAEALKKRLNYLFVITPYNCGFKFTFEIISIIIMNLVQMDCPSWIESKGKIWVGVDDLEKGNRAKARIEMIKFKLLHENDEYDFNFEIVMQLRKNIPENFFKFLAKKLINPTKTLTKNTYASAVPLGHFNYNYRKAVGMSSSRYLQLSEMI
uniref:NYN domain-containing protein n=1 Tax=Tetranychus urticae TaxID=32264 RepID=T1KGK8_TETUR